MAQIDDLIAAVAAETTVNASAVKLINSLPALILSAQSTDNAATNQKLADLAKTVQANADALSAAVTANTPAAAPPAAPTAPAGGSTPDAPASPPAAPAAPAAPSS